jgi:hypothetical protein
VEEMNSSLSETGRVAILPGNESTRRALVCALIVFMLIVGLVAAVMLRPGWFALDKPQAAFLDSSFKGIGGLVALVGAALALMKYFDERKNENRIALIEAQKPFSTKRQEVYFQLVSCTATIGNRDRNDPAWKEAEAEFWWLFWGVVPMVADDQVGFAVNAFSEVLADHADDGVLLRNSSMQLARACRKSLGFLDVL